MYTNDIHLRVRYAETDQMGYVYYGNYATYFEVARVESLRSLGLSYKEMELSGILLPVLEYHSKFIRPAKYDDLLTIHTIIPQLPGVRICFEYEVYNEQKELLCQAKTTLAFIQAHNKRPCGAPPQFLNTIARFFGST